MINSFKLNQICFTLLPFIYYLNKINNNIVSKCLWFFLLCFILSDTLNKIKHWESVSTFQNTFFIFTFLYLVYTFSLAYDYSLFSAFYSIYYFLTYFILLLNIYLTSSSNDDYASQFSSFINGLGLLIAVNFTLYLVGIYNINEVINNQNYGSAKVLSLYGYETSRVVFYFSSGFSSYGLLCVVYILCSILRRKSSKSKISYVICSYALGALAFLSLLLVDSRNSFITLLIAFLTYNSYVSKLIFVGLTPVAAYLLVYLDQSIVLLNSYLIETSRSESLLSGREEIWTNSIEYIFQLQEMEINYHAYI